MDTYRPVRRPLFGRTAYQEWRARTILDGHTGPNAFRAIMAQRGKVHVYQLEHGRQIRAPWYSYAFR
jgi:hypothetical protein